MIAVEFGSRRVWVLDRRCHHGAFGLGLAALGVALPNPWGPVVFGLGVALLVDDWHDRWWLPARRTSP